MNRESVLVTGAGGFIGGHLLARMKELGYKRIRAVDRKPLAEWYQVHAGVESYTANLEEKNACYKAADSMEHIYNLAADMGGMGFIENNRALCMLSVLINTHMLMAAKATSTRKVRRPAKSERKSPV